MLGSRKVESRVGSGKTFMKPAGTLDAAHKHAELAALGKEVGTRSAPLGKAQ